MSERPKIYISGPMRHRPDWNFPAFDAARDFLEEAGYTPISPADLDRAAGFNEKSGEDITDVREFMRRDIQAILDCEAMAMLPGWEQSQGAKVELQVAKALGLKLYYLEAEKNHFITLDEYLAGGENILDEAARLVYGPRQRDYGHPYEDFSKTALIWTAILGIQVKPEQIPLCMIGVKLSREIHRPKRDNIVDMAGYAGTLELVRERIGGW